MQISKATIFVTALLLFSATCSFAQGQNPGRRATDAPETQSVESRYLIEFRGWSPQARAAVNANGGQLIHEFPELRTIAARMSPQAAQALQRNPLVSFIEIDPPRFMMARTDSAAGKEQVPYGITMVQADQIPAVPANRKVCIIDSGYYLGHEDLQVSSVRGDWDNSTGDPLRDAFGHGTHVAGTIVALANNRGVVGVAGTGQLNLHIIKVFGDDGKWAYSSTLIAALNKCQSAGANVVSMSLGGDIPSRVESRAFANAYEGGTLSVAAAGNGGNNRKSYPASYDSVISVAAIDSNKVVASFSQKNVAVELAAPGVAVLSTVPYIETNTVRTRSGITYSGGWIEHAPRTSGVTANLVDGGLCSAPNGGWQGGIVLCQRGSLSFYEKVHNAELSGALGTIIYNNIDGSFSGTLGEGASSTIPAVSLSLADGSALKNTALGTSVTVVSTVEKPASGYEAWNGTSMATPHVSGVAAMIWSNNPNWTNVQIRQALQATALDLGARGRDTSYGFGLVQAKAALAYLQSGK